MTALAHLENSTNVRSIERDPALHAWAVLASDAFARDLSPRRPGAPWVLRAAMRALTALSPALASRLAARIFCTPPRPPAPPEEREALSRARPGALVVAGDLIRTWTWGEGPPVLLVHGWGGRGGQLHGFVPGLLARGYSVVTFDGPGHGSSGGRLSSLVEIGRAAKAVATSLPGPLKGVIAHSVGGPATATALDAGMEAENAVFVAPPFALSAWVGPFSEAMGLDPVVREGMVRRVEERVGVRLDALTMERIGPRMRTPLLVIHDEEDREVPYTAGAAVAARWPGARMHATRGLGHKRVLGDAGVIALATGFVGG